jgi:PHD/YefM family antitoxin component YafN of YafNO toxin-antitoxin module
MDDRFRKEIGKSETDLELKYMMEIQSFETVKSTSLDSYVQQLICRIAEEKGRVEIVREDGCNCVIISKQELDALEDALEILANTDGGKKISRSVQRFAKMDEMEEAVPCVMAAER